MFRYDIEVMVRSKNIPSGILTIKNRLKLKKSLSISKVNVTAKDEAEARRKVLEQAWEGGLAVVKFVSIVWRRL